MKPLIGLVFWVCSMGWVNTAGADSLDDIERKKAQVVYNLALFVSWPAERFATSDSLFHVCLLGSTSEGLRSALSELAAHKSVKGHPIQYQTIETASTAVALETPCHIVFIGQQLNADLSPLLTTLHEQITLTISDRKDFAEHGGIIGLLQVDQRVRFGINLDAADQAKLTIRAQLLVMSGTSLLGKKARHLPR